MALIEVREKWLEQVQEEPLEPTRRIIDPHHHFFVASHEFPHYTLESLHRDTDTHKIRKTVYLQCWEGHREDGPEHLKPVGETEWVDGIAKEAAKSPDKAQIGAMIGTADLRGRQVEEVLDAHLEASTLFRGIRQIAAWDASPELFAMPDCSDPYLYRDPAFRAGFKALSDRGLVFDAYHYHTQAPFITELAKAFPSTRIVIDHLGTPLGVGPYAGHVAGIYQQWASDLAELAKCPNVYMKLGGLAMPWTGFDYAKFPRPPTSDQMVAEQGRHYHHAIAVFGPERCMFESNFPVDKCGVSYGVLWNAFKKIAATYSEADKDAMFYGTAALVYGIRD